MEVLETLTRIVDGLTYRVRIVADYDPDLSYLGRFTSKPTVPYWDRSADALIVRDGHAWEGWATARDERGRLSRVDVSRNLCERGHHRYIDGFQCPESAKACIQDAKRLDAYEAGDWSCYGVIAELIVGGETVAEGSCYGFDSDMDDAGKREAIADVIAGIDVRAELARFAEQSATAANLARGILAGLP